MAIVEKVRQDGSLMNIKVSGRKKLFYISGEEGQEGYEKVTNKDGSVYYHKYIPAITGVLNYVGVKSFEKTKSTVLSAIVKDSEANESYSIGINLYSTKGTLTDTAKAFINYLVNWEFGRPVEVKAYPRVSTNPKTARSYTNQNFVITYLDVEKEEGTFNNQVSSMLFKDGKLNPEIPKGKKLEEVHEFTKEKTVKYNFEDQDKFYTSKIHEILEKYKEWRGEKEGVESKDENVKIEPPKEEEFADLPF